MLLSTTVLSETLASRSFKEFVSSLARVWIRDGLSQCVCAPGASVSFLSICTPTHRAHRLVHVDLLHARYLVDPHTHTDRQHKGRDKGRGECVNIDVTCVSNWQSGGSVYAYPAGKTPVPMLNKQHFSWTHATKLRSNGQKCHTIILLWLSLRVSRVSPLTPPSPCHPTWLLAGLVGP